MSDNLTPEAVERLAADLQSVAAATSPNDAAAIAWSAAATLRALSARLAEVEAERDAFQKEAYAASHALKNTREERAAAEAALATARADALREAAAVAEKTGTCLLPSGSFLSERCRDAILALIPKEQTNDH